MRPDISTITSDNRAAGRQMTRDEIIAFFERRQAAYDNLDAAGLAGDYALDCTVDSPTGGTHQGPASVELVLQAVFSAFLNLRVRVEDQLIAGNQVAQILTIEGTHIGEFLGLPPTGRPFRLAAAFVYELRGRQIVRERRVYDFTGLLVQIGVLKAKPA
jgi:predicted ester cyclase